MVITNLDLSIQLLKEYTLRMIEKCEDAVNLSVEYMMKKDMKSTKKLIRQDDDIDILREYIRESTEDPNLETKILDIGDGLAVTKRRD